METIVTVNYLALASLVYEQVRGQSSAREAHTGRGAPGQPTTRTASGKATSNLSDETEADGTCTDATGSARAGVRYSEPTKECHTPRATASQSQ